MIDNTAPENSSVQKRVAYLVLAHDDPKHFARLVNALESDVYAHIDAKADIADFFRQSEKGVTFVERRHRVAWAGISMVDALIALIDAALPRKDEYSHFVFLTGADYPIKSPEVIRRFFLDRQGHEFIRFIDMRKSPEHYMKHLNRKHFMEPILRSNGRWSCLLDRAIRKFARSLRIRNSWDKNLIPYFGHTWCALTPACCEYISNFHRENPRFYAMNKHTMAVDEHYFHTIVGNSKFALASDGLQAYEGRGLWRLVNFHLICPSLQKWFSIDDWEEVSQSDKLFVRKINSRTGGALADLIDEKLRY